MSSVNVTSIEALRRFQAALHEFETDVHDALTMFELESRRPIEWIETDRTLYWPREVRKAEDRMNEARLALERCELTINGDDGRSCYDERKAFQKAKRRLELCEQKVKAVSRWKVRLHKEVNDFKTQVAKVKHYMDSEFVRGLVAIARMAESLEQYIELQAKAAGDASGTSSVARTASEPSSTNGQETP